MLKLLATGVWICAVTLGSVYVATQAASDAPVAETPDDFFGGLDYVRGDVLSIPVFLEGRVQGYFLTRLVYTADPRELAGLSVPPKFLIADELYTYLVGNRVIDFPDNEGFDLDEFRIGIRDSLNERVGREIFKDVLVEQIDFLAKEDIRSNLRQGRYTMKRGEPIADRDGDIATAAEP